MYSTQLLPGLLVVESPESNTNMIFVFNNDTIYVIDGKTNSVVKVIKGDNTDTIQAYLQKGGTKGRFLES